MNEKTNRNDLQSILSQAIAELKQEQGDKFDPAKINLAELERRTGITRGKLRRYQKDGFIIKPHGNVGRKAEVTVLTGYTGVIDDYLRKNITNAVVIYERLVDMGYQGGQTQVRVYIETHQELIPPKRQLVDPQGNRGRRYETEPGEAFQMDWGFVNVETDTGTTYQSACFAMICHHCGQRYIEFFPNAKQENLFIGMLHAFYYMGVPRYVLTDNMKSDIVLKGAMSHRVALGTDARGNITRLDNALSGIPERLERANEQLTNLYNQQEAAKAELGKPFPQEAELAAKSQRLAELDAALNMEDTVESRAEKGEAERPSVLADLKSKSEHIPPAKRSEGYEEVL